MEVKTGLKKRENKYLLCLFDERSDLDFMEIHHVKRRHTQWMLKQSRRCKVSLQ